jgi:hypothetical protein
VDGTPPGAPDASGPPPSGPDKHGRTARLDPSGTAQAAASSPAAWPGTGTYRQWHPARSLAPQATGREERTNP